MLAGVTGVMCSCGVGVAEDICSAELLLCKKFIGASGCGVAGGGIDRSTGEGVSPGMSSGGPLRLFPLLRFEGAGKTGVEFADFVPRRFVFFPLIDGIFGVMRLTAACRLREGRPFEFISSLLGEAVRRFVPAEAPCCIWRELGFAEDWLALYAPSHGLVSGDISSKSSSAGEGSG